MIPTPSTGLSGERETFEDFHLLNMAGREKLLEKYAEAACDESLDFDWQRQRYNRMALVNFLITKIGPDCRYLEIGCDENALFHSVPLNYKIGVDPVRGGNRRMTSDAFFAENAEQFDLIFIDGLHTYEQLHRDVENALGCLKPGGFIAMHDLVPRDWKEAHVPRLQTAWTGDVWKVGVELAHSEEIDFRIVLIDHGVGILRHKAVVPPKVADMRHELENAGFADFHKRFPDLPTVTWRDWLVWLTKGEST